MPNSLPLAPGRPDEPDRRDDDPAHHLEPGMALHAL